MIRVTVDGKEIEVEEGKTLLAACLENGIYIPNLCFLEEMKNPPASCRLCFVEIEGVRGPVTSCKVKVKEGMVVRTDTEEVRQLQSWSLRLLLSVHHVDCCRCPSNKKCELQRMAKLLRVPLKPKQIDHIERKKGREREHPLIEYNVARCVLCGKCIYVCRERTGHSLLTFAQRGFETVVEAFIDDDPANLPCRSCFACVEICPVSALAFRENVFQDVPELSTESEHA